MLINENKLLCHPCCYALTLLEGYAALLRLLKTEIQVLHSVCSDNVLMICYSEKHLHKGILEIRQNFLYHNLNIFITEVQWKF